MTILVTGGAGYIGSHTIVELIKSGHSVVVVDNLCNSSRISIERVEKITCTSIVFYEADIRDKKALNTILDKHLIDTCIHFAGLKAVGESISYPHEYYDNNITGTLNLIDVLRSHNVKNIIFSSSATVYGEPRTIPITENCPKGICTNPYGWTKWMIEQILTDLHTADEAWNIVLLRYFNPIGAHPSGTMGENPNGIPTYPATSKQDKSQAANYFQKAYNVAMEAINNPGPYKLQETFRDVNLFENDRNAEWLLWADHTLESEQYNGAGFGWGNGGAPENFAGWFTQWNYCGDMKGTDKDGNVFNPVLREPIQGLGRPWTRMAPIPDALAKFTETDKDSRWDGTFATQYRVNMAKGGNKAAYVNGANGSQIKNGETYLKFLSADEKDANVTYAQANGSINAGTMDGEPAFVIKLENISRQTYPGLWKTIDTRTDRNMETELGSPNAGSIRPYPIAKFSEFYFIAAEAAVKGATGEKSARDLINVIRARAGKWTFSVGENKAKVEDHSAELTEATPAEITIDYIMDERLREYFGEGYRWFDLVRTQTWEKFASVYHIADGNGRQAVEKKRTIEKYFYLRPIPQGQLDAMTITPEEKAVYQNPGY